MSATDQSVCMASLCGLRFLTVWRSQGTWSSYTSAHISKSKHPSAGSRSHIAFYDSGSEISYLLLPPHAFGRRLRPAGVKGAREQRPLLTRAWCDHMEGEHEVGDAVTTVSGEKHSLPVPHPKAPREEREKGGERRGRRGRRKVIRILCRGKRQ